MYAKKETITPTQAAELLTHKHPTNRPLSRDRARRYLDDMREGRWTLSPQGLAFDEEGNLVDGQHRLHALKNLDHPLEFWVTRDVSPEMVRVMDQGLTRTAAQIAAGAVESDVSMAKLTAAARAVLEHGLGQLKPSNTTIVDFVQEHQPKLERYAALAGPYGAGVHAAFVFADMCEMRGVHDAALRLGELRWSREEDPMRALARALSGLGGQGAKAKSARFYTALAALEYVDRGDGLLVARRYDTMPARVRGRVGGGSN